MDVRPDDSGSKGIAIERAGSRKLDLGQPETKKSWTRTHQKSLKANLTTHIWKLTKWSKF